MAVPITTLSNQCLVLDFQILANLRGVFQYYIIILILFRHLINDI